MLTFISHTVYSFLRKYFEVFIFLLYGYLYLQGFVSQCYDIFIINKDVVFMLVASLIRVPVLLYTGLCTKYEMFNNDFFLTC